MEAVRLYDYYDSYRPEHIQPEDTPRCVEVYPEYVDDAIQYKCASMLM